MGRQSCGRDGGILRYTRQALSKFEYIVPVAESQFPIADGQMRGSSKVISMAGC